MRNSKEKVPKRGIRPSASVLILTAVAAAILTPMLSLPVSAQEPGQMKDMELQGPMQRRV
jgi:hypothetical protein